MFDFDDDVPDDDWTKWGMGVCFPILFTLLGLLRMAYPQTVGRGQLVRRLPLDRADSIWLGLLLIALSLFMHARFFWSNTESLAPYVDWGKLVALVVGIASIGMIIANRVPII